MYFFEDLKKTNIAAVMKRVGCGDREIHTTNIEHNFCFVKSGYFAPGDYPFGAHVKAATQDNDGRWQDVRYGTRKEKTFTTDTASCINI
jgi:hypothetical protein